MILQNPKYPILGAFMIIIPKMRFFLKNIWLYQFFTFRLLQLHVEFLWGENFYENFYGIL